MSGIANVYLITNAQSSSGNHRKQEGTAGFCSISAALPSSLQLFFLSWKLRESAVHLLKVLFLWQSNQLHSRIWLGLLEAVKCFFKDLPNSSRLKSSHLGPSFLPCSLPVVTASELDLSVWVRNWWCMHVSLSCGRISWSLWNLLFHRPASLLSTYACFFWRLSYIW